MSAHFAHDARDGRAVRYEPDEIFFVPDNATRAQIYVVEKLIRPNWHLDTLRRKTDAELADHFDCYLHVDAVIVATKGWCVGYMISIRDAANKHFGPPAADGD